LKAKQLKHKRIELELRQLAKTLPPGAKLPAERDMAIEYQCNFLTVRKALKNLVDDGLVIRRVGSGTFTRDRQPERSREENGTDAVGMLIYQRGSAYAFKVMQAMAHCALTENIKLRSCWLTDFGDEGVRQTEALVREGCQALTLPWFPLEMANEVQSFVRRCPLPISLPVPIAGFESYCFEDRQLFGATLVTTIEGLCQYFVHLGHGRIAFLGPDAPRDAVLLQMLGAYSCFTSRESFPTVCGLVSAGASSMDQLAERWKTFSGDLAIISYDDEHALRFMTAMHKLGLGAPEDYCIIGFNNSDASHYSDPPLSTVQQNFNYIGSSLLKSALALSRQQVHQSHEPQTKEFILRFTCGGHDHLEKVPREVLEKIGLRVVREDDIAPEAVEAAGAAGPDEIEESLATV
jgi:DNA-binding transcriptional regulator YhcF (GntR family)